MSRARILADYVAGGTTAAEFDVLDGLTSTTAELNYVDGVTSNVQTQLNAKAPLASPTFTGDVTLGASDATYANNKALKAYVGTTLTDIIPGDGTAQALGTGDSPTFDTIDNTILGSGVTFPAGHVIQVVPFTSATATNVTSATTWVSIAASSVTITSKQANSKFLYHFDASVECDVTTQSTQNFGQLARNGSKVTASNQNLAVGTDAYESSPAVVFTYTDSPSASKGTAITYTVEVYRSNAGSWQINQQALSSQPSGSQMNSNGYVMEIAG